MKTVRFKKKQQCFWLNHFIKFSQDFEADISKSKPIISLDPQNAVSCCGRRHAEEHEEKILENITEVWNALILEVVSLCNKKENWKKIETAKAVCKKESRAKK